MICRLFISLKPCMKSPVVLLLLLSVFTWSCGDSSLTRTLPNVSGTAGEVLVVIDQSLWDGETGQLLRDNLTGEIKTLPQPEPAFDLVRIPPAGFRDRFMLYRSIMMIEIDPSTKDVSVSSIRNQYAESQLLISIKAPDVLLLKEALTRRIDKIKQLIDDCELERVTSVLVRSAGNERCITSSGGSSAELIMPAGYRTDFSREGLSIVSCETPSSTQSLIIAFLKPGIRVVEGERLLQMTDSIMSAEIKGPDGVSFMKVENKAQVVERIMKRNNRDYDEMRGLWTLEGGYMGGPFISCAVSDTVSSRTIIVTGFIYAPKEKKRELLRQVEALIYSLKVLS